MNTQGICDSFNKFFAKIAAEYTRNLSAYRDGSHAHFDFISFKLAVNKQLTIPPVSLNYVEKQLLMLDGGKAVGLNGISPKLLCSGASPITPSLSIKDGIYPNIWTNAKLTPFIKRQSSG